MYGSISQAIGAVANHVKRDQRNEYAKYDYASADAIYSHVREAIADQGLRVYQNEIESETMQVTGKNGSITQWVKVQYELALIRDQVMDTRESALLERVTVMAQVTGAQTFAAIRTYALKYWLRGLFLLDTGDVREDIDSLEANAPTDVKPKAKPKAKATEGVWQFNTSDKTFAKVGDFENSRASSASLFLCIQKELKKRPPGSERKELWEAVGTLAELIPEAGVKQLTALRDEKLQDAE